MPRHREPRAGQGRWYHDAIPVLLGLIVLAIALCVLWGFLRADWHR